MNRYVVQVHSSTTLYTAYNFVLIGLKRKWDKVFTKRILPDAAITKNYFLFLCRKSVEIVFVKPVGLDLET